MAQRQFFIGATFYPNLLVTQRIDAFRAHYDSKYGHASELIMALLPPFQMRAEAVSEGMAVCADILESHFMGVPEAALLEFTSVEFFAGRRGAVLLRPAESVGLFHCQEEIYEAVQEAGGLFRSRKAPDDSNARGNEAAPRREFFSLGLPVARGPEDVLLQSAVGQAVQDFRFPLRLLIKDITWFEKLPGHWPMRRRLFTFDPGPAVFTRELNGTLK